MNTKTKTTIGAVAVLLAMALSGCASNDAGPNQLSSQQAETEPVAAPPHEPEGTSKESAPSGTGRIVGTVTDDELLPLADATIRINGTTVLARTMDDGSYLLNALEPGDYELVAEAAGHASVARSAQVREGDTATVDFELAVLAVSTEYVQTRHLEGYMECSIMIIVPFYPCAGMGNDKVIFDFQTTTDVKEVVAEVVWTPSMGGTGDQLDIEINGANGYYTWQDSPSPLVIRRSDLPVGVTSDYNWDVGAGPDNLLCVPYGCPGPFVPVAFQQSFDLYETLCFGTPCADDYQGRP